MFTEFTNEYISDTVQVIWNLKDDEIREALTLIEKTRDADGTVWLIGNGGLASLAEHMAVDFQLAGVKAIALTQSAAVTTYANDWAFEDIFYEQLKRLARPNDLIIAMSGSGNSVNVLNGYTGLVESIGIGPMENKRFHDWATTYIGLNTKHIGQAQDAMQVVLHILTYYLMSQNEQRRA
jgi:D-sedoheptulose 7-phosphate isomerase